MPGKAKLTSPLVVGTRSTASPTCPECDQGRGGTRPFPEERLPTGFRLVSLDALRGFDMFWILGGDVLVRSLQKVYDCGLTRALGTQMEHCEWAGFHFYDLIFPLFVFMVGVSLVFSLRRLLERAGRTAAIKRIVRRSMLLFVLGVLYMGGIADGWTNIYFAGVLHRIAVAYFFAALLFCFLTPRALVVVCFGLLLGYWAMLTLVPVPGLGHPSLAEPGHNLAHYIDGRWLPGQRFEGTLLSTMAAVANCLLGVFAGLWLDSPQRSAQQKVRGLVIAGGVSLLLGLVWGSFFPIIKLLWTSSYVLVACGYSALLLGSFFQVIECWGCRRWATPFIWIGMNALPLYLVANVVSFQRLASRFVGGDIHRALGRYGDLITSSVALGLIFWLAAFLCRRKLFLRL